MASLLAPRGRPDRAFERLYQRHAPDVYRYSLAVLRDPDDAEDVTQTTFLNAYRAFEGGERPRNAQAWLITIAHNVCRQRFRQAQRRPSEVILDEGAHAAPVKDDEAPSLEDVQRALGELPFNQRSALVMRELEGRSYKEIAASLDLTVPAVETLLFRARRALREQLEEALTCHDAEIAISKQLDGRLPRGERGGLRAHLRVCEDCARSARRVRAQRTALKGLGALPLPASLSSFFGGGTAAATGGAGLAIFSSGIVVKVAAVAAGAAVVAGAGVEGARHLPTRDADPAAAPRAVAAPVAPTHGVASVAQRSTQALAVLALPRRADAPPATPRPATPRPATSRPAKVAKAAAKAAKAVAKAAGKAARAAGLEANGADKPAKTKSKPTKPPGERKAARREDAAVKVKRKAEAESAPLPVVADKPKKAKDGKAPEEAPPPEGGTPDPAPEAERPKVERPKLPPIELPVVVPSAPLPPLPK